MLSYSLLSEFIKAKQSSRNERNDLRSARTKLSVFNSNEDRNKLMKKKEFCKHFSYALTTEIGSMWVRDGRARERVTI